MAPAASSPLDQKIREHFAGNVVRKDLTTDHGWKITLDQGLDLFQWFEFSPFSGAAVMQEARSAHCLLCGIARLCKTPDGDRPCCSAGWEGASFAALGGTLLSHTLESRPWSPDIGT